MARKQEQIRAAAEGVNGAKEPRAAGARVPRLALTKAEAAEALGVSVDFLEQHVMPELRVVRRGRRRLIALGELERWLQQSGEAVPLPADATGLRF
jgi:excisionase family DNA binding protein